MNKKQNKTKNNQEKSRKILVNQILKSSSLIKSKKIGVAVSGGIDSMVLLDVFNKLKKKINLNLYVLHYNHRWRKKSSNDVLLVSKYCKKNKIRFMYKETIGKVDKDEEVARIQRYSFFKECSEKNKLDYICTAHHMDDQIETIIFRLARGTGPGGMLPIKELINLTNNTKIFRPFLDITKEDIYNYAQHNKVSYVEDTTNKDLKYKRNLIRNKIIPLLKNVNNEAPANILMCSDLIYSQNHVLDKYFSKTLKNMLVSDKYKWNRNKFLKLDYFTQKAFLYWFLSKLHFKNNVSKINLILDAIYKKIKVDLSKELSLVVNDFITFIKNKPYIKRKKQKSLFRNFILNNKPVKIPYDSNWTFVLKPLDKKVFSGNFPDDKEKTAYVNLQPFNGKGLALRYRKPRDVFMPLGFSKNVKLKKYLINKKISKDIRYKLPMLCYGNEVLWMPGYSLSDRIKVLNTPTHLLRIQSGESERR